MVGLQVLNYFAKMNKEEDTKQNVSSNIIYSERKKQYEAVSGEKKDEGTYSLQTNIIEKFLDKCNDKDIQGAYDLLSDDCKKTLYPSINDFIDGYYNKNFNEKKSYSYQAWSGDTYAIQLRQDILSTGMYSDSAYTEDYYTIVSNSKLNINRYIKKVNVNKEIERYGIKIKIVDIDFFNEYSVCNIKVLNKTEQEIMIDSGEKNDTVFFTDKNDVKFNSFINELDESKIRILKGENKDISIKFNCVYREKLKIDKVTFGNIIMNYNKYKENTLEENDIKNIEVNV